MSRVKFVVCELCGKTDASVKHHYTTGRGGFHHVGTAVTMRCEDCGGTEERTTESGTRTVPAPAKRCRDCCVSGHATRYYEPAIAETFFTSLTEALDHFGFSHRKSEGKGGEFGAHDVLEGSRVVFAGTAGKVWQWLRDTGRTRAEEPAAAEGGAS